MLYDGSAFSRLWEKSAIGILIDGTGLLLADSEVIFCREHRGVEFIGLEEQDSYSKWIEQRISINQNVLQEAAILEALRVSGNKVVLSENFEALGLEPSISWAMRWSSENHPSRGDPESEIIWFESKDLLHDKSNGGLTTLEELLLWCVEVEDRGRIPEVLVIDEEHSVVTYRLSEADPTGDMAELTNEFISDISKLDRSSLGENGDFYPSVKMWPHESVGIPLHGGRQLDRIESEVIRSNDKEPMSVTASILNDLWSRGLNTRSGFKYGTTWRCYAGEVGKGHAPWLVVDPTSEGPENWAEACLSSRLASGVNKKWLYPINDIERWRYLQISRPPSDSRWSNPKRV